MGNECVWLLYRRKGERLEKGGGTVHGGRWAAIREQGIGFRDLAFAVVGALQCLCYVVQCLMDEAQSSADKV